jgi:hypothetical protein
LDRRLSGPQSRSGRGGEEKNSQPLPRLELLIIQPLAQCHTTQLSRLFTKYYYGDKIKEGEIGGTCSMHGRDKKSDGKRPLGRPRRRWKNNENGPWEIGWKGMDWIHLAQDKEQWRALVNTVMNVSVP